MEGACFRRDDRAVSPVIGVILMVAITVILAAVVGSTVFGIGGSPEESTPQASFDFSYEQTVPAGGGDTPAGVLTITHEGGDPIRPNRLYVRGEGYSSDPSITATMFTDGAWIGSTSGDDNTVVAGDSVTVKVTAEFDVSVVYVSSSGGNSATLGSDTGPLAE